MIALHLRMGINITCSDRTVILNAGTFCGGSDYFAVHRKIGIKQMFRNIFHTEHKLKTILVTGGFCFLAFVYAILFGKPKYMLPLGFMIMIPFVGIAEETGWRGLSQPELDKC